jgi:hypothetical protein
MTLKARKPETVEKRLKLFLFGSYKVGKTTAALHFPATYVIDGERGTEHDQYKRLMEANGSEVLHTNDVDEVTEEVRTLGIEKHAFRTVLIDPITVLEADLIEKAEKEYGPGDMRIWAKRDRKLKRLVNLLNRLDMNVIVTAHGKIDYGPNMTRLGTTFDGWKRWPFCFDLIIELERRGPERVAIVRGTRIETFADGEVFPWSYAEFQKRYPSIDKESKPAALATAEQVAELRQLLEVVKMPDDTVDKWLVKAGVDALEDMTADTMSKCVAFVKAKLPKEVGHGV